MLGLALALIAARPIVDYHRLDAYFALYAPDSSVPWKAARVRIDTYSGAPIALSVYQTDPAAVIVAGQNTRPRAIETRHLRPLASWSFVPPGGYRVQSNDVAIPLGSREGFFVVEARRGNAAEQVWINRSRVGLVTKERADAIALYGADLGTGRPLEHMRVSFLINRRFDDRFTGKDGLVRWSGGARPIFALAQWGASVAFVSFFPQPPVPPAIVAVKTDSAVVHAGNAVHVVGFARVRQAGGFRGAVGGVSLALRSARSSIAAASAQLDQAGAFSGDLLVPAATAAGDFTLIAQTGGATAATAIHVDADAAGLLISARAQCEPACNSDEDVPVLLHAAKDGSPARGIEVNVRVIRAPHLFFGESGEGAWGTTPWYDAALRTDGAGEALLRIPRALDGLASTFGVRAQAGGATAETRIIVPTAPIAIRVRADRNVVGTGFPATFSLSVNDVAHGTPIATGVRVELLHGASILQQTLVTDRWGRAQGAFTNPPPGSSLILARADAAGREAADADQLQVEPQTVQASAQSRNGLVRLSFDRSRYAAGENASIDAFASGAAGFALLTVDCASSTQARIVTVHGGHASASFRILNAPGMVSASAAFVRDGALQVSSAPIDLDAPGHAVSAALSLDRSAYSAGAVAVATLAGLELGSGTVAVRLSKGLPTGSALFETAPQLLAVGTTETQQSGGAEPSWHPWVDASGKHVQAVTFARRSAPPADLTMTQGELVTLYWNVSRTASDQIRVPVPPQPGAYELSILKMADDGRVAAASGILIVR